MMRLASCLLASVLTAVVWHASPAKGENYLRAAGTDAVNGAGRSDNGLPKYTSKSGIASRVSPEAKALRVLSALHGNGDSHSLKFGPPFLSLAPFDASLEQDLFNQRNLQLSLEVAQRYYVPLTNKELIALFKELDPVYVDITDPIENFIGISVLIDNTILVWDHHEDGFDNEMMPTQNSTEVWGDSNITNGAPPGCNDNSCDVLNSDTSIVVSNSVPTNSSNATNPSTGRYYYDGGDKVYTTGPITMTRGAFPLEPGANFGGTASDGQGGTPGSRLAGATEVFQTTLWGTEFEAPVGQDIPIIPNGGTEGSEAPFEHTGLYVMGDTEGTQLTLTRRNGTTQILTIGNGGSASFVDIVVGDRLTATNPVQVHLLTGDVGANWEMRWYALLPVEFWSYDYWSPVGMDETTGSGEYLRVRQSSVWLYNPDSTPLTVTVETLSGTTTITVPANSAIRTAPIPTGSGVHVSTSDRRSFLALTQTDNAGTGSTSPEGGNSTVNATNTGGRNYDWGHPLLAETILSYQVLVGVGWGCPQQRNLTYGNCTAISSLEGTTITYTSVVWVTPLADATIYVDYNNDGAAENITNVARLTSVRYIDPADMDMSGARIWAVRQGEGPNSTNTVKIAVAWGQDPSLPEANGGTGLDAGTVIPPTGIISAGKGWASASGTPQVTSGDTIIYTITTENVGKFRIAPGTLRVFDTNDPFVTYTQGTTFYAISNGTLGGFTQIPDNSESPFFPLDPSFGGFTLQQPLLVDQSLVITYNVTVNPDVPVDITELINRGYSRYEGVNYTFEVETPIIPRTTAAPVVPPTPAPVPPPTPAPVPPPTPAPVPPPTPAPVPPPTPAPVPPPTPVPTKPPVPSKPPKKPKGPKAKKPKVPKAKKPKGPKVPKAKKPKGPKVPKGPKGKPSPKPPCEEKCYCKPIGKGKGKSKGKGKGSKGKGKGSKGSKGKGKGGPKGPKDKGKGGPKGKGKGGPKGKGMCSMCPKKPKGKGDSKGPKSKAGKGKGNSKGTKSKAGKGKGDSKGTKSKAGKGKGSVPTASPAPTSTAKPTSTGGGKGKGDSKGTKSKGGKGKGDSKGTKSKGGKGKGFAPTASPEPSHAPSSPPSSGENGRLRDYGLEDRR